MDKVFYRMVVTTDGELAKPPISREQMAQAINRALLDVLGWDWYACRLDLGFWMTLRRPVRAVLRERSLSTSLGSWNDLATQQAVEDVLRAAAARLSERSTP
jgi:hypothetical protein